MKQSPIEQLTPFTTRYCRLFIPWIALLPDKGLPVHFNAVILLPLLGWAQGHYAGGPGHGHQGECTRHRGRRSAQIHNQFPWLDAPGPKQFRK